MDFTNSGLRSMERIASSGLARTASMDLRAWFLKIFSRMSSHGFSFGGASQRLNSAKLSGVAGGGLSSGAWGGGKRAEILPGSTSSLERWLGAPSSTNRISCLANFRDRTFRKAWKHTVFDCRHDQIDARACVIKISRGNTIWMRRRCSWGIFHRGAVFNRRTWPLAHLTICSLRIK